MALPEAPVRLAGALRALDRAFLAVDAQVERVLPGDLNPLARTGAIAFVTLLVSLVTGIPLLFWYVPSVAEAHATVQAMTEAPWGPGLLRSLHRYSSDACVLFSLLHLVRLVAARKLTGARWLAWVTGLGLLVLVWLVGWLGFLLVWDERALRVAVATARVLDVLPLFAEPLSRSFVAEETVGPLLLFVVYFAHMLLPLALGVLLWLHVARLTRPAWLTRRVVTVWILLALVALSLAFPADLAPRARMDLRPRALAMDAWYLAPLWLAGRAWPATVGVALALVALTLAPWWMRKGGHAAASVDPTRCNGCTMCSRECPYAAITMVGRDGDGKERVARVEASRCVACGLCAAACPVDGLVLPGLPERGPLRAWVRETRARGEDPLVAFRAGAASRVRPMPARSRAGRVAIALALAGAFAGLVALGNLPLWAPSGHSGADLVVTFVHPGCPVAAAEALSQEELDRVPAHMRRKRVVSRERVPVRMRIWVGDELVVDRSYTPRGLHDDGNSVAIEELPMAVGTRVVRVQIGESADLEEWKFDESRELSFGEGERRVVLFDRTHGFRWR